MILDSWHLGHEGEGVNVDCNNKELELQLESHPGALLDESGLEHVCDGCTVKEIEEWCRVPKFTYKVCNL